MKNLLCIAEQAMSRWIALLVLIGGMNLSASGAPQLLISDNFDDSVRNSILWGDKYVEGNGNLIESDGHLNYTCSAPTAYDLCLWPQRQISLNAAKSWSILLDVHVSNLGQTANGTKYSYGLVLFKNGLNPDAYITLMFGVDSNGQREVNLSKFNNGVLRDYDIWNTTYTDITLRLDWNGTNKTIQGYFKDNNGQWEAVDISASLPSLAAYFSDADKLVLGIGGRSCNMTVLNGDMYGDNFFLYSIPTDNTLTVSKQNLGALSTKGVKLSAPAALAVPKGTVLYKGAKAVYTWKRDGTVVGTGKSLTVKQSGEYAVTLSYKRADGGTTTTTADIASVTIYTAPKIMSLRVSQTTDTLTSGALKNTSVVSGESLSLTVSIAQTAGAQFGPFNYKWYRGSALVKTQQSSSASDTFVTPAYGDKADAYKVEVETVSRDPKNSSKPLAVAKSKAFKAKVILPPSNVTLKLSANPVKEGKPLTLSASAKGTSALKFTWYKNDMPIASGSAKKFTKKPVTVSDAGVYYVVVSQDKTTRRAQSAPLTVSVQRTDGTIVSGAQPQSAPMTASPSAAASTSSVDPRRRDAAVTLSASAASTQSTASTLIPNLAPLTLSAGDMLTLSGSATREYIIVSETQHSTGAYRYEWRDNLTAEFQDIDAETQLTLRFITTDGGVYELSVSGSVNETGVFELKKK